MYHAVKRISSTKGGRRPKKKGGKTAPEIALSKPSKSKATRSAEAPMPAAGVAVPVEAPAPVAVAAPAAPAAPAAEANGSVVLGPSCTIHEAQELRAKLLAHAEAPGPYEIDGRGVQQVDTAGVQLVVAFALDCLERNIKYSWKGRSAPLEDAIRVLGVGALLESPG
jgi:phospholipid transport system transporter-binding protein